MQALYCAGILASAPFIVSPAIRSWPYARLMTGLVLMGVFIPIVVRGLRNGELKRTLPQTYEAAKGGRTAAGLALQTATVVAVNLAFWLTR